jgi:electron transfer flavoprotein beta subunit
MKIVVCVKQVGKLEDEIEFVDDDRAVDPDFLERELNEWDGYALEEALRLRDDAGGEVVAVSVGDDEDEDALRRCLAMGADRAIRVWCDDLANAEALTVARALAGVIRDEQPTLVLCGVQSSDAAQGATGGALAGFLGLPVVCVAKKIALEAGTAVIDRELEGGLVDVVEVDLPAVVTVQTGINEPRYVTLRALQEAKAAEIDEVEPEDLGTSAARVRTMSIPERRRAESIDGDAAAVALELRRLIREAVGA